MSVCACLCASVCLYICACFCGWVCVSLCVSSRVCFVKQLPHSAPYAPNAPSAPNRCPTLSFRHQRPPQIDSFLTALKRTQDRYLRALADALIRKCLIYLHGYVRVYHHASHSQIDKPEPGADTFLLECDVSVWKSFRMPFTHLLVGGPVM